MSANEKCSHGRRKIEQVENMSHFECVFVGDGVQTLLSFGLEHRHKQLDHETQGADEVKVSRPARPARLDMCEWWWCVNWRPSLSTGRPSLAIRG